MRLEEVFELIRDWWTKGTVTPCPYCSNPDRLQTPRACMFNKEHPEAGNRESGADPPCLCDNFACNHQRRLGIRC